MHFIELKVGKRFAYEDAHDLRPTWHVHRAKSDEHLFVYVLRDPLQDHMDMYRLACAAKRPHGEHDHMTWVPGSAGSSDGGGVLEWNPDLSYTYRELMLHLKILKMKPRRGKKGVPDAVRAWEYLSVADAAAEPYSQK
ncbi:hypothetical protein [Ramlibacter albus]|uniref:Uncharacterized protein n=1 Tax=Ramlibacter albus TaxID=2079448 RepID=A0A923MFK4_9BURK|nr:hypothetical protein [Ramlibacter albus]MBC5768686.1 hypothetical protein [Ramlibacter albus]